MTHVVVGYPSLEDTFRLVMAMVKNGVDAVELQIPFSDPVADGPTILKASEEALQNGATVEDSFILAKKLRENGVSIPLFFMTYANIVMAQGIKKFIEKSAEVGINGFIIPDLPLDTREGEEFFAICEKNNVEMIPLYAPTMSDERYNLLGKYAKNLVYAVSRTGITGVAGVSNDLENYLQKIKNSTNAKIALGFGIQSAQQVKNLEGKVEYAVIGSHILRIFQEKGIAGVEAFLKSVV